MSKEIRHSAFLVRWQDDGKRWRTTVENAYMGEKFHLTDKSELMRILRRLVFDDHVSASDGI
jgi:hypothetical protein